MKTRASLRFLPLLLGLLLIPAFVARVGLRALLEQLRQLGPEALSMLVPYALGTALSGWPWAWLLPHRDRPGAAATVASRFAASGANALLPFFGLAGEPCRLLWLRRDAHAAGLAAIVVDRLLYNAAGGLLLLGGALLAFATPLAPWLGGAAAALGVLLFCVSALVLWASSRWAMARALQRMLDRLLGKAYREPEVGERVDAALRTLASPETRGARVSGLLLHLLARLTASVELYVALWSLHASASFADALILAGVPIATSVVASTIPSQIGVQEGAQAFVCAALGFDPALGLVITLLQRLRQLAFVPVTLLLLTAARGRGQRATSG